MILSQAQKQSFFRDGYVVVPGVVPSKQVNAAMRAINHSLGQGMRPEDVPTLSARSYCPELQASPAITDLYNATPARLIVESVVGEGKVKPIGGGQIALRFPTQVDKVGPIWPHIDGMYTPTNGVAKGSIYNFTALAGFYLSDVSSTHAGNFTVWPGSHRIHEKYFRQHGPQSLLNGMPKVDIGQPVQVTGKPGDFILAHYLLAHGVAPNHSPHTRYAIFFRVVQVDHENQRWESMTDAWLQWAGMRDVGEATD